MSTTQLKQSITSTDALHVVQEANFRHVMGFIERWTEFGSRGRGLAFTESGIARVSQILGFIGGVSSHDKDKAAWLAKCFIDRLDFLSNYGGMSGEESDIDRVPNTIVEMHDDGTFGGFALAWHKLIHPDCMDEVKADQRKYRRGHTKLRYYQYCMNGGLLFHGLSDGAPPVLAVRIGSDANPWGIHT